LGPCRWAEEFPQVGGELECSAAADRANSRVFDDARGHEARLLLGPEQDDALGPHLRGDLFDLLGDRIRTSLRGKSIQFVKSYEVSEPLDRVPGPFFDELVKDGGHDEALERGSPIDAVEVDD